jgi:hypothetical protein
MYDAHVHITAQTPEQLITTLRRIAHHIEVDHDLTDIDRDFIVDTVTCGDRNTPAWSVRVTHEPAEVHA